MNRSTLFRTFGFVPRENFHKIIFVKKNHFFFSKRTFDLCIRNSDTWTIKHSHFSIRKSVQWLDSLECAGSTFFPYITNRIISYKFLSQPQPIKPISEYDATFYCQYSIFNTNNYSNCIQICHSNMSFECMFETKNNFSYSYKIVPSIRKNERMHKRFIVFISYFYYAIPFKTGVYFILKNNFN